MKRTSGVRVKICLLLALFLIASSCKGKEQKSAPGSGPLPETAYFVEFIESQIPTTLKPGEFRKLPITIKNIGDTTWPHQPKPGGGYEVNLAYHWLDDKGNAIIWDGERTNLPFDLLSGAQVTLEANVRAPETPGKYRLQFQMVQELVAWFGDDKGADTLTANVEIKGLVPAKKAEKKEEEKVEKKKEKVGKKAEKQLEKKKASSPSKKTKKKASLPKPKGE